MSSKHWHSQDTKVTRRISKNLSSVLVSSCWSAACQSMVSMTVGVFYCFLPHVLHSDTVLVAQYRVAMAGRHTLGYGYDTGANRSDILSILELAESLKHDNIPLL